MITKKYWPSLFTLVFIICCIACFQIDLTEKHKSIKNYKWYYNDTCKVSFNITDTIRTYKIYVIVRHRNSFDFLNVWLKADIINQFTLIDSSKINVKLGDNETGWLGDGMSNIFERRFLWRTMRFKKPGLYYFNLTQIMRENPLQDIVSVGIRIEK